jgi:hypothetical protein
LVQLVFPNTNGSYHAFDLTTTQYALTGKPLVVQSYHYGGFAVRGPMAWLSLKDASKLSSESESPSDCRFLNDHGSDRIKGNHEKSRWVSMSGRLSGERASIIVLCHADNLRALQAARLHRSKPYFCFSPCVEESIVIDREHPLHARYRLLITDAEPDAAWIENQWQAWNRPTAALQNAGEPETVEED